MAGRGCSHRMQVELVVMRRRSTLLGRFLEYRRLDVERMSWVVRGDKILRRQKACVARDLADKDLLSSLMLVATSCLVRMRFVVIALPVRRCFVAAQSHVMTWGVTAGSREMTSLLLTQRMT